MRTAAWRLAITWHSTTEHRFYSGGAGALAGRFLERVGGPRGRFFITPTWMSRWKLGSMVKWLGSMGCNLLVNIWYIGVITH